MGTPVKRVNEEVTLHGIGVSPGVVHGEVFLFSHDALHIVEKRLEASELDHEIVRFEDALKTTRMQIRTIQQELEKQTGLSDASILDAHLMVLDDHAFIDEVVSGIRAQNRNAEVLVRAVAERYATILSAVNDEYIRERVADVRDVTRRILRNLAGGQDMDLRDIRSPRIVVASDLAPSETASLRKDMVIGFATDMGSPTSHTAVMARALEIPAIVGLRDVSERVMNGDEVLIDGNKGVFIIHPTVAQLEKYGKLAEMRKTIESSLGSLKTEPAQTRDGRKITLSANIEGSAEVDAVMSYGAEGVGLFRSEYLYLSTNKIVSEEEQTEVYTDVARRLAPQGVIIRTMDLGGDKYLPDAHLPREANPFLGCRSIRLSLLYPKQFRSQLRAILRASAHGNVKLMYPMVSSVGEVARANEILDEAKADLEKEGSPFNRDIEVGVMIEIPSAALTADHLARKVKFFSIGTNDLIQYTLAVDRVNDRVAYLYEPTHPAVLKLIRMAVEAAHANGIWVGVCGAMAADPVMTPLLLGLGVDELSVAPSAVPIVKDVVRNLHMDQARDLATRALNAENGVNVLRECRRLLRDLAPELLDLI